MASVNLTCNECSKSFSKEKKEYDRWVRKGREQFYCSQSCSTTHGNKVTPHGNQANLVANNRKTKYMQVAWFLRVVTARTKKASYKKGPTDLTLEYLLGLWESQNGICPITGWKLILPYNCSRWSDENPFGPSSASLDRIDNSIGYVQGNVRFIAVMANYARNNFTDEEVIEFAKAVVEYNKS